MLVLCSGYNKDYNECKDCTHSIPHQEDIIFCDMNCGQDRNACCNHQSYITYLRREKLNKINKYEER